jgi:WD40 repeat protein
MAKAVIDAVRRANELGRTESLRETLPPAHEPFIDMLDEKGQSLPVVILLGDGRTVLQVGTPHVAGSFVIVHENHIEPLSPEILAVGRSPNRRYFAIGRRSGVTILDGWDGPLVAELRWPNGREGVPEEFDVKGLKEPPVATRMIPFPDGKRALLVSPDGVFVLTTSNAVRLLPTAEQIKEDFADALKERPKETPSIYGLSMEHGAVSPDGRFIATGHQSSAHFVFDAATYKIVGEIGPISEYPHHAAFSGDGEMILLNACHFYNGATVGVPTRLLPGLKTEFYKPDPRMPTLEDGARVYASVDRSDEFIIGDAHGYLRAFDRAGKPRWRHFIGSTIGDIDISPDGKKLVVSSYAGFLCFLDLDTGERDPFAIGTATHRERRRWLFWKNEPKPLVW